MIVDVFLRNPPTRKTFRFPNHAKKILRLRRCRGSAQDDNETAPLSRFCSG